MTVRPSRPQALPEYRNAMLAEESLWSALSMLSGITGKSDFKPEYVEPMYGALTESRLWWVGTDAIDLIEAAAPTMPPATLTEDFAPDLTGFVFFERPLVSGHDADNPEVNITVDAVQWFPTVVGPDVGPDVPALSIVSWQHMPTLAGPVERFPGERAIARMDSVTTWGSASNGVPLALGRADWPLDWDTDERIPGMADGPHASVVEDRRLLAALWQLSSQAGLTETIDQPVDRPTRKRLERARQTVPDVRLVNLAPHRRRPSDGDSGGSQRTYTRRWVVEGHWRQQACGPGYSQHRPVYIAPHIKGPEDKPLVVPESVKVWR